jgi:hypothetical protein
VRGSALLLYTGVFIAGKKITNILLLEYVSKTRRPKSAVPRTEAHVAGAVKT